MNRRDWIQALPSVALGVVSACTARRFRSSETRLRFDVRAFGANGDDQSDDTDAFLRASVAAAEVRGIISVPMGKYRLSRTLLLASGVAVEGQGAASILNHEGVGAVLMCLNRQNVSIRDLAIGGRFSFGIVIQKSSAVVVSGCQIGGATIPQYNYAAGAFILESAGVTIEGCAFDANGLDGARVSSDIQCDGLGQRSTDIRILRNECHSTKVTTNIRCYDLARAEVRGNRVKGARLMRPENGGYGIVVYETGDNPGSCHHNTIAENEVAETEGSGIYLNRSHDSRVIGNRISRTGHLMDDTVLPVAGVALNQSNNTEVSGNTISDSGHAGIAIASNRSGAGHVEIRYNDVAHAKGFGIHLRGLLTSVEVEDNTISDTTGGIGSTSTDRQVAIRITNNTITGTRGKTPGIALGNAASSRIVGNRLRDCGGLDIDVTFGDSVSEVRDNIHIPRSQGKDGTAGELRIVRPPAG